MVSLLRQITSNVTVLVLVFGIGIFLVAQEAITQAAPVAVWGAVGLGLLAGVIRLWFLFDAHRLQNKIIRAETTEKVTRHTIDAERHAWSLRRDQKLFALTAAQMAGGLVHIENLEAPTVKAFNTGTAKLAEKAMPTEGQVGDLLAALQDMENILVVGSKGSGKTSLLQWLEAGRRHAGQTIILDSHAQPSQWQGKVIGIGRAYKLIKNAMVALVDLLDQRYKHYATGKSDFEPITMFADEWTMLPAMLKEQDYNVQKYSIPMLTEGRKVNMAVCWGIHSDRAKPLGLEGVSDLKECFDAVVYLKNVNGQRYGLVDYGEGKLPTKFMHPGPFVRQGQPAQLAEAVTEPSPSIFDLPVSDSGHLTESENAIIAVWKQTGNKSACYRAYHKVEFGDDFAGSVNGDKIKIVTDVLRKAGLVAD